MAERIKKVLDQVKWDMKRGKIGILSIEDILDIAEATLTDEEYEHFTAGREYLSERRRTMRTVEQQEKNIHNARAYAGYEVTQAIQASHYSKADKETMIGIINATYTKDALARYQETDTMVREVLQDIIEETYYGKKQEEKEVRHCPKCGNAYTETPALSREDGKTAICPDCGTREAIAAFENSIIPKKWEAKKTLDKNTVLKILKRIHEKKTLDRNTVLKILKRIHESRCRAKRGEKDGCFLVIDT